MSLAAINDDARPPWFILDIPRPPSVNSLKVGMNKKGGKPGGKYLGSTAPVAQRWIQQADKYLLMRKPYPKIRGKYELIVIYPANDFGAFDPENCQKVLSDWLQRVEMVENDRWAWFLGMTWGEAPYGCRVRIRPWVEA